MGIPSYFSDIIKKYKKTIKSLESVEEHFDNLHPSVLDFRRSGFNSTIVEVYFSACGASSEPTVFVLVKIER